MLRVAIICRLTSGLIRQVVLTSGLLASFALPVSAAPIDATQPPGTSTPEPPEATPTPPDTTTPTPPPAASKPSTPPSASQNMLRQTLENMGYTITDSGPAWISFEGGSYRLLLALSGDETLTYTECRYDIPADKMSKVPSAKILEWNGTHADYFGTIKWDDGSHTIVLESSMLTSAVTPKTLRTVIDRLVQDSTSAQNILNPGNW